MKAEFSDAAVTYIKDKGHSTLTLYTELISGGCGTGCCGTSGDFIFRRQLLVKLGRPSATQEEPFSQMKVEDLNLTLFFDSRLKDYAGEVKIDLEKSLLTRDLRVVSPLTLAVDNQG